MGDYLDLRFCSCCVHYRFRSESCSLVRSPLTVAPSAFTGTLCNIRRTEETIAAVPWSDNPSIGHAEPSFTPASNSVHRNTTSDICYHDDKEESKKRRCLETEPLPTEPSIQAVLPKTDPILQATDLSFTLPKVLKSNPDFLKDKTYSQNTRFLNGTRTDAHRDNTLTECISGSEGGFNQDKNSQSMNETSTILKSQRDTMSRTNTTTEQTVYIKPFHSDSHSTSAQPRSSSPQSKTTLHMDKILGSSKLNQPAPTDSAPCEVRTLPNNNGPITFSVVCSESSSTNYLPQQHPYPRHSLDSGINFSQSETVSTSNSLTATTPHKTQHSQPFSSGVADLPNVHVPISLEPNNTSEIKISSSTSNSNRIISNRSHQTVYSLHESLTSTCTQQYMHDSGISPSSPVPSAAPPQPQAETQALAQQANLHVYPHHHPSSPPHLLTPDKDPDICQPMAIREEIRLTPQIQGPPIPTPPSPLPKAQTETVPQGKASKSVPPCITRPLSRATVMEGSPVTLELEVTGQSKPMLTWWVANNQFDNNTQAS